MNKKQKSYAILKSTNEKFQKMGLPLPLQKSTYQIRECFPGMHTKSYKMGNKFPFFSTQKLTRIKSHPKTNFFWGPPLRSIRHQKKWCFLTIHHQTLLLYRKLAFSFFKEKTFFLVFLILFESWKTKNATANLLNLFKKKMCFFCCS